jgi:demethylmenaquinone methyltransferase/2-methoxy-6-polyprenyl-1,4-benzoquinol methylase
VLPRLGRLVSRHDSAYAYLPASVGAFPPPREFAATISSHGFRDVSAVPLSLGVVYLYVATRG